MRPVDVRSGGLVGGYNPIRDPRRLESTQATLLQNWRIRDAALVRRPGSSKIGGTASARRVITLLRANIAGAQTALRCDQDKVYEYVGSSNTWNDVTGADTLQGGDDDTFTGDSYLDNLYLSNGVAATGAQSYGTYSYGGLGSTLSGVTDTGPDTITVPPAKVIEAGFAERVWLMNTIEGGSIKQHRARYCQRGDPTKWSGTGAGYYDLADDPYPINAATALAGRLFVFKGSSSGGSIIYGVESGLSIAPVQWRTMNPESGIGCLCGKTVSHVTSNAIIFLAHDEIYLFDGSQLRPLGGAVAREILDAINHEALWQAHAYYDDINREYNLFVPLSQSEIDPNYRYVYHLDTQRWSGPDPLDHTTSVSLVLSISEIWSTITGPWTDHDESWADLTSTRGRPSTFFGRDNGDVTQYDEAADDDDGTTYESIYESPLLTFQGLPYVSRRRMMYISSRSGQPRMAGANVSEETTEFSLKNILAVTLIYQDISPVDYTVEVSIDGKSTWMTVGTATLGTGTGRVLHHRFYTTITGDRFYFRVSASSRAAIIDITYRLQHAGRYGND